MRNDFFLLDISHYIDNALVNPHQIAAWQRSRINRLHVFKNNPLPIGLVNWQRGIALELAYFDCCPRSFAQQRDQLLVQLVNLFSPILDIHVRHHYVQMSS